MQSSEASMILLIHGSRRAQEFDELGVAPPGGFMQRRRYTITKSASAFRIDFTQFHIKIGNLTLEGRINIAQLFLNYVQPTPPTKIWERGIVKNEKVNVLGTKKN